jgi:hypothetical protein
MGHCHHSKPLHIKLNAGLWRPVSGILVSTGAIYAGFCTAGPDSTFVLAL